MIWEIEFHFDKDFSLKVQTPCKEIYETKYRTKWSLEFIPEVTDNTGYGYVDINTDQVKFITYKQIKK